MAIWAAEHLINLPTWYSKKDLKPARKLIERYIVKEEDMPDLSLKLTPEAPIKAPKEPSKKPVNISKEPKKTPRKASTARTPVKSDLDFALAELQVMPEEELYAEDEEDEYDDYYGQAGDLRQADAGWSGRQVGDLRRAGAGDTCGAPTSGAELGSATIDGEARGRTRNTRATSQLAEFGGNINYSEVVYDKLDKKHLNRTNIIDKNTNSDGTSVTLTREERFPKKPTTDNLPKIRQYKKPEKGPETTEGKVW